MYLKRFAVESMTRTYEETNDFSQALKYCQWHGQEFPCTILDTMLHETIASYSPQNQPFATKNWHLLPEGD